MYIYNDIICQAVALLQDKCFELGISVVNDLLVTTGVSGSSSLDIKLQLLMLLFELELGEAQCCLLESEV